MCGVFAAITTKLPVQPIIVKALKALEYRGYDSAGIALWDKHLVVEKKTGFVSALDQACKLLPESQSACIGIGHTRWATHGQPSEKNAHPHTFGDLALVHNGIIENHEILRAWCIEKGYTLQSDTDSEVIVCLLHDAMQSGISLQDAMTQIGERLEGQYACICIDAQDPDKLYGVCHKRPLLYAQSEQGCFISSDVLTLVEWSADYAVIPDSVAFSVSLSKGITFAKHTNLSFLQHGANEQTVNHDGFESFMHKEIVQQKETLLMQSQHYEADVVFRQAAHALKSAQQIHIVACGSSYHAALVAKYWCERWLRKCCHVEIASEYRYREPVIPPGTSMIVISQSGETADTIAAATYAQEQGIDSLIAICNVVTSHLATMSDYLVPLHVGPEIGVASTKAFTGQVFALLSLLHVAYKKYWDQTEIQGFVSVMTDAVNSMPQWKVLGDALAAYDHVIYIGRDHLAPIAMEGALKIKEISYIHAEAYAGGELKHGPLALIDNQHPTVALIEDNQRSKIEVNIGEIKARDGAVFTVDVRDITDPEKASLLVPCFNSILLTIPLQCIAYYAALARNCNVDKPRNLAKCVTVE